MKFAIVVRLLNSGDPHVRVMGIKKVTDALINNAQYPPEAPKRLAGFRKV